MLKLFTEEEKFDPSKRAEAVLDFVLDETSEVTQKKKALQISVEDALEKDQIIKKNSNREKSRILFLSKDTTVLEEKSTQQIFFTNLDTVFDEVHVLVLSVGKRKTDTIRIGEKVWVYPMQAKSFLRQPFVAFAIAKQQLQFTGGFRPDIVVSLDPFESGIAGYFIARRFKRAFQIHINEDFYTEAFKDEHAHNAWRLRFAHFVLKRVRSVRVRTKTLQTNIKTKYKKIKDIALLPRYFNIKEIIARTEHTPSEKLYPQFAFTMLFVGALTSDSTFFRAIDAARVLLRTSSIGLVVIGDGTAKKEFQQRAQILGIDTQVMFKSTVDDVVAHMRASDILICTDTTNESEEIVVQAAASGLPIVMSRTTLRDDLFSDGFDAFICDPEDTQEFAQKLTKFLNRNAFRIQFAQNAQQTVRNRIVEDPHMYQLALRDSIEGVLYMEDGPQKHAENKQVAPVNKDTHTQTKSDTVQATDMLTPDSQEIDSTEIHVSQ